FRPLAHPRDAAAARIRSRVRHLRSRRLAGAAGHRPRDGSAAGAGHARPARDAGALAARVGPRRRARRPRARAARSGGRLRRFAALYDALDATTSTNAKVAAMQRYFAETPPADAAWGLFFLTGQRLKRLIAPRLLAVWGCERARVPGWMAEECFSLVGDLAETVALMIDTARTERRAHGEPPSLASLIEGTLLPLRDADEDEKRRVVMTLWDSLERREMYLLAKLLTGEMRVGV